MNRRRRGRRAKKDDFEHAYLPCTVICPRNRRAPLRLIAFKNGQAGLGVGFVSANRNRVGVARHGARKLNVRHLNEDVARTQLIRQHADRVALRGGERLIGQNMREQAQIGREHAIDAPVGDHRDDIAGVISRRPALLVAEKGHVAAETDRRQHHRCAARRFGREGSRRGRRETTDAVGKRIRYLKIDHRIGRQARSVEQSPLIKPGLQKRIDAIEAILFGKDDLFAVAAFGQNQRRAAVGIAQQRILTMHHQRQNLRVGQADRVDLRAQVRGADHSRRLARRHVDIMRELSQASVIGFLQRPAESPS